MKSYKTPKKSNSKAITQPKPILHNDHQLNSDKQLALEPSRENPAYRPLDWTKPAILAFLTLTEDADFAGIGKGLSQTRQGEAHHATDNAQTVPDDVLYQFLATVLPEETAAWEEMLQERVARYATWPTNNFTIVCRREKVRLRVENRVVVEVTAMGDQQPL